MDAPQIVAKLELFDADNSNPINAHFYSDGSVMLVDDSKDNRIFLSERQQALLRKMLPE